MKLLDFLFTGSLALAVAACGEETDGGRTSGGGGSTASNTSTTTASGGAGGSTTSSTGGGGAGCCKVRDDAPNSCPESSCGGCVNTTCGAELGACEATQACGTELQVTFLPCMCDAQGANDMAAEDACIAAFHDSSAEAAALTECVQTSCAADCLL